MSRQMKDSGLKWVGQIPADWEVTRLQSLVAEVAYENVGGGVKTALKFYMGTIVPKANFDADSDAYVAKTIETYTVVRPDDIIINGLNLNFDFVSMRVAQVRQVGAITSAYIPIRIKDTSILNPTYANYLLKSYDFCKAFHNMGHGVRKILAFSELKKNKLVLPPLPEQRAIAAKLDALTSRIESESKKITAEIARLDAYKKSVITEVVCRGLDPKVKMKESGTAWCPKIPEHWNRVRASSLFSLRTQKARPGERQLAATQKYGVIYQDDYMRLENQSLVLVMHGFGILKHVEPGDFVISMRSFQGGLEYSENRGSISSAYTMIAGDKDKVDNRFYRWFFKSSKYINALQSTSNLTREGQAMRFSNFTSIPLFEIPLVEQRTIADYLDATCARVDAIIAKRKRQLDRLDALKRSLVYEYVTGKRSG